MKTSFMTPAGMLAGNPIGKLVDGTPTQPAIPSHRSYRPKAKESEPTGVQCPGGGGQKDLQFVH